MDDDNLFAPKKGRMKQRVFSSNRPMLEDSRVPGRFWGIWFRENSPQNQRVRRFQQTCGISPEFFFLAAIRTGWEFIVGKCGHDLVNLYLAKHGGTLLSTLLKSSESCGFESFSN